MAEKIATREAYGKAATALDATGQAEDKALASDVRAFLAKHPDMISTPEIFAARYSETIAAAKQQSEQRAPPIEHTRKR